MIIKSQKKSQKSNTVHIIELFYLIVVVKLISFFPSFD